jgi:hypothetical protein
MIAVQFPEPQFNIKVEGNKRFIFDAIRRSWLLLTEEEWVRQNFINYLVHHLKYPSSLIAVEKEIQLNELKKRFDVLVYDTNHKPWMIIECKAPEVSLNENVLQQVLRYNMSVPVNFIVITNGHVTIGWEKTGNSLSQIMSLPEWETGE